MANVIVVGLDGAETGEKALAFAKNAAAAAGGAKLILCYVIEWSPYTFQTAEENEKRHKRREEELKMAHERVMDPAVAATKEAGFEVEGVVRHGDPVDCIADIARKRVASQIIVGRRSASGLHQRFFGSVASNLVMNADQPVTVVP